MSNKISFLIPCYFNELNIPVTTQALIENESNFSTSTQFEYIFIDDGSKDNTLKELMAFREKFHEKVNNFVFGIDNDALINEYSFKRKILNHIKINHGYTNIYDIMKITSLTKENIQSILAKLVIDYNGKFIINNNGIVTYYFPELMLTIESERSISKRIVSPIWLTKISIPAFTGNSTLSNALIFTFNAFNMGMSLFVIHNDLTIDKIKYILTSSNFSNFDCLYIDNAYNDAPILLGWIPLIFSISLFLIPTTRLLFRKRLIKQINNENGYRGIMKSIVNHIEHDNFNIPEENLIKEWKIFTGCDPDIKTLSKMIIDIGGEINIDKDGKILYSFEDIAKHNKALKEKKFSKLKSNKGDFQLEFVSISQVISHMTCYKLSALIG